MPYIPIDYLEVFTTSYSLFWGLQKENKNWGYQWKQKCRPSAKLYVYLNKE